VEAAEENVILEAATPTDASATLDFSGEPTNPKLMKMLKRPPEFGLIPPTTLVFGETQLPAGYTKTVLQPLPQMEG
jgi:hypothetical protein